jgi:hypothetical protein
MSLLKKKQKGINCFIVDYIVYCYSIMMLLSKKKANEVMYEGKIVFSRDSIGIIKLDRSKSVFLLL